MRIPRGQRCDPLQHHPWVGITRTPTVQSRHLLCSSSPVGTYYAGSSNTIFDALRESCIQRSRFCGADDLTAPVLWDESGSR
jgi:hypothetical protein